MLLHKDEWNRGSFQLWVRATVDGCVATAWQLRGNSLQISANRVVQALASSLPESAPNLIDAGASKHLVQQLLSSQPEVAESAVRTINTLSLSSPALAKELCTSEALTVLVALLAGEKSSSGLRKAVANMMGNVCSTGAEPAARVCAVR